MRNILLTGATKGLGLDIAKTIITHNSDTKVYGVNRGNTEEYSELMQKYPDRIFFKSYDLSDTDNLRRELFKNYLPEKTAIHGFVNNAAFAYDDIITNMNADRLKEMYQVNVFSPLMLTKLVVRNMLLYKIAGSIIHISSISVHTGYKGLSMYASTKGALEAFSKNTAREWGGLGIRSNSIVAGFMETGMSSTLSDSQKNRIYNRTALKKQTDKESVASTINFLLTDAARSITGQNIFVDSGTI